MANIKNLVKEYNSHKGECRYCKYGSTDFDGVCRHCNNGEEFVDVSPLKEFLGNRIAGEARKEFLESESGIRLKTRMEIREGLYGDFSNYVNAQKATLDKLLDEYCMSYNAAKSDYEDAMKSYMSIQVYEALKELDGE